MTSPAPLIVLAPPRSFSSVVSAMLGQHPEMYGLPELHLAVGDTLEELLYFYKVAGDRRQDGLLRVISELYLGGQTEEKVKLAKLWLLKNRADSTRSVLDKIMERVNPRRIVEKSVTTVWKTEYLRRTLKEYPDARFLHLTRHPRGQCLSMLEAIEREWRVTKDLKDFSVTPPVVDPQILWFRIHHIITEELAGVPNEQWLHVRGEDLLADTSHYMKLICQWLGVRDDDEAVGEMHHPERSPYSCIGPKNAPFGSDPKFLQEPALRPSKAKPQSLEGALSWRDDIPGFADNVKELALQFGYQ